MNAIPKRFAALLGAIALCVFAVATASAAGRGGGGKTLTPEARQALVEALAGPDGEFAAHALYSSILAQFGQVLPYAAIRDAETRHVQALKRQLEKYGVQVPADPFVGKVKAPKSLADAARDAVASEEKNVAMYERYLTTVKDYPDLTRVFTNLQRASREAHLPALKAASASGGQLDSPKMQAQVARCQQQHGKGVCQRFCWPQVDPGKGPAEK